MTTERIDKLEYAMAGAYAKWEQGESTSPSMRDFTYDLEDLGYALSEEARDRLADQLFDASVGGADLRTLAMLAVGFGDREGLPRG